jgi:threonyl-tRNA synthetase
MAVIGQREAEAGTVALRVRGTGKKQDVIPVDELMARVVDRVKTRALAP